MYKCVNPVPRVPLPVPPRTHLFRGLFQLQPPSFRDLGVFASRAYMSVFVLYNNPNQNLF